MNNSLDSIHLRKDKVLHKEQYVKCVCVSVEFMFVRNFTAVCTVGGVELEGQFYLVHTRTWKIASCLQQRYCTLYYCYMFSFVKPVHLFSLTSGYEFVTLMNR